jgi:hypothetical protein
MKEYVHVSRREEELGKSPFGDRIAGGGLRTLEVFKLESDRWIVLGAYAKTAKVRVEPFVEIELDLSVLWLHGFLLKRPPPFCCPRRNPPSPSLSVCRTVIFGCCP